MVKSKADQDNRHKRQRYVASKSGAKDHKAVHDDPIRSGDTQAEKEATYV